jgi:thiol:disulfide interchange protein
MNQSTRPFWGLFIILACVLGISAASKLFRGKEIVPWRADLSAAREESRRENKPVFAYFTAEWCGPCQSMKGTTWADRGVESALRGYVPVKIDIDENRDLAEAYSIDAVPTFAVLDGEGRVLKSATGALRPQQFLEWIE